VLPIGCKILELHTDGVVEALLRAERVANKPGLGLPSFTAKYGCQCLWRVRVGSCYWRRHALSVYVALHLETLDFKDRSEPLMRQLASRVDVPDQPRLHYPYVVAVADAHL
jgi:hypothetical protein